MEESESINRNFMELLNSESHLDQNLFSEARLAKFDSLMFHCVSIGIECCGELIRILKEDKNKSIAALVSETEKMMNFYVDIRTKYAEDKEISTRITREAFIDMSKE
jgi:hypothetical protein